MDASVKERLLSLLGERSLRAVALRSGIEPSKLHRQLSNELKVQTVVQICRAYAVPMLAVFALVGFITEEEKDALAIDTALKQASNRQIAEEILRRSLIDEPESPATSAGSAGGSLEGTTASRGSARPHGNGRAITPATPSKTRKRPSPSVAGDDALKAVAAESHHARRRYWRIGVLGRCLCQADMTKGFLTPVHP